MRAKIEYFPPTIYELFRQTVVMMVVVMMVVVMVIIISVLTIVKVILIIVFFVVFIVIQIRRWFRTKLNGIGTRVALQLCIICIIQNIELLLNGNSYYQH